MSDDDKKKISMPIANTEDQQPEGDDEPDDALSRIDKTVNEHEIVIYMKGYPQQPMCGFSARAAAVLASYERPFHSVNVLEDQEIRQGIKDYSDWPTIPQIYIGGDFVGGSDILMEMHENDEIEPLIEEAFE